MSRFSMSRAIATIVALVTAGALSAIAAPNADAAAPTCRTTAAPGGFTVTVCITGPASGASVTGSVPVTATVQVTGSAPSLNGIQYTLDGKDLLFDFQSPYVFTLHTYLSSFGTHTLGVAAVFSGGYSTPATTTSLRFGLAFPPSTPAFKASAGTNPPANQPLVVAVGGDGATGMTSAQQVTNLIASWNPNLFMYIGDVYQEGTSEEFLNWYGENGSYFSQFRSITDPVIGNHEYVTSGADPYFKYWGNPPHYYSVNTHGWHIVSLDDTAEFAQSATTSAQYKWLQNDLATNPNSCTLVSFHRPVYTLNPTEAAAEYATYWRLLSQYHVSLVLNGHSHSYQHWKAMDANGALSPTGISEFVVGTAGNWISPFATTDSRVAAGFDTTATAWGALRLSLSTAGATYQFQDIAGATEDYGSLACQGRADTTAPTTPTGLTAKAASGREVDLNWAAASDNVGVTAYQVLRNGVAIGTAPGYQTSYADTTTDGSNTYIYTVAARDAGGNQSPASVPASASTPSATPVYVQSGAVGTSTRVGSATVALNQPVRAGDLLVGWFGQYDASGQVQVSDNIDGAWTRVQGQTYSSGSGDVALYYTKARAAAAHGVIVSVSAATPTYLQAAVGDYWGTAAAGAFAASAVGQGSGTTAASSLTTAVPAGSLVFTGLLTGGAPGAVTPGKTNGVALVARSTIASQAVLAADATSAAAGPQQAAFTMTTATDWYAGVAAFRAVSTSDTVAPSVPAGVTATAPNNSPVTVSWSPSSDNVGVAGYTVYRGGIALGDTNDSQRSYVDATAAPGTTYSYTVVAYDAAGNRSDASAPATVTTPAASASYVQSGVATTGSRVTSATIPLDKPIQGGNLLVGWFGQYDAAGPVQVADSVNGAWTRVQGEPFSSGNGDVSLYYVKSATAPSGVTVTISATTATYLQGSAADYGGAANPGALSASAIASGNSTTADSGLTAAAAAGAVVVTSLITGGNPGSAVPRPSAGVPPALRAATGSGSVVLADVTNAAVGAQDGGFTLGTSTDWYAVCAVFGP